MSDGEESDQFTSEETSLLDVFFGALGVGALMFVVLMALPHESSGAGLEARDQSDPAPSDKKDGPPSLWIVEVKPANESDGAVLVALLNKIRDSTFEGIIVPASYSNEGLQSVYFMDKWDGTTSLRLLCLQACEENTTHDYLVFARKWNDKASPPNGVNPIKCVLSAQ
jgi:hypothetical protein